MSELTRESALKIMSSRTPVSAPGKYQLKVTNDPQGLAERGTARRERTTGPPQISIANLAAYTPYHKEEFKKAFKEGRYNDAVNNNLTIGVRENDYMPQKNEMIEAIVDYVQVTDPSDPTKESKIDALFIISYNKLPTTKPVKLSVEDLEREMQDVPENVTMEFADTKTQETVIK